MFGNLLKVFLGGGLTGADNGNAAKILEIESQSADAERRAKTVQNIIIGVVILAVLVIAYLAFKKK